MSDVHAANASLLLLATVSIRWNSSYDFRKIVYMINVGS